MPLRVAFSKMLGVACLENWTLLKKSVPTKGSFSADSSISFVVFGGMVGWMVNCALVGEVLLSVTRYLVRCSFTRGYPLPMLSIVFRKKTFVGKET